MTYTELALTMTVIAILFDLFITRSKVVTRKSFWNAYAIMLFFQLITNWWLTSRGILTYNEDVIVGRRLAAAPIEDLFFGFAMITMTISLWIFWGRRGIQREKIL
jgi:lycopene cyclase domain-containing protein